MKKLALISAVIFIASFNSYTKNNSVKTVPVTINSLTYGNCKCGLAFTYGHKNDLGQADVQ